MTAITLGYGRPLYLLAFDHCGSFEHDLFHVGAPLTEQLARCAGDSRRFDRELRPDLVVETLRTMQAFGVEPDAWKIEGLDAAEDCARVAQAGAGGRDGGSCVVLGRDAEQAQVLEWLRTTTGYRASTGSR